MSMEDLSCDFVDSLKELPGVDAEALMASLDTEPGVGVRINRHKTSAIDILPKFEDYNPTPVSWCRDGVVLSDRPSFSHDPLWHAGAYYVQDSSSMIYQQIAERLARRIEGKDGISRSLNVLDFCAAPGGKTTALINGLPYGSKIVANEYVAQRGKILRENLERWGYPFVITTGASSSQYYNLPPMFDIVAIDAPCSGEGMMRKENEARRQWSRSLVDNCAQLQRSILADIAHTVRPGGYLVYSTCTFNTKENEENSRFISDELGFIPVAIDDLNLYGITGGDGGKPSRGLLSGVEALRFMPHITPKGEGLYVGVFQRPADEAAIPSSYATNTSKKSKNRKSAKENFAIDKSVSDTLRKWVRPDFDPIFYTSDSLVTILPEEMNSIVESFLAAGINITGKGLPIAELKGKGKNIDAIPDSRFALSPAINEDAFPCASLTPDEAIKYLRREAIVLDPNIPRGYVVVSYEGAPLGMVKNLGNRANNLYPQAWRIKI